MTKIGSIASVNWARELEAGSVVYEEAQGTICVKVTDRNWRELVVEDGVLRDNSYIENYYIDHHVVHSADSILDKIRALPVGHVITLKDAALIKESDDSWAKTGSILVRSDEDVKSILYNYGVTL